MNDTRLSAKQAADLLGKSTRYIQKHIKAGNLSATRVAGRKYMIDRSEFYRVFPSAKIERMTAKNSNEQREIVANHSKNELITLLKSQNEFLREQLDSANNEKSHLISVLENTQKLLEAPKPKRRKLFGIL